jgi:hypothetical protein
MSFLGRGRNFLSVPKKPYYPSQRCEETTNARTAQGAGADLSHASGSLRSAKTTAAHINHFYKAVAEANDYPGPAVINVYTTCQPEHGVPDCNSGRQAKMAVESPVSLFLFTIRGRERRSESA